MNANKNKAFALFAFICVHLRTSAFDQAVAGWPIPAITGLKQGHSDPS
jgi:hypothetical protein